MNLKRVSDRIQKDTTIVFHSTRSRDELADIILSGKFSAGKVGGAMLGKGFYANQHLYQAQKGNYGIYILKARVYGISSFLILDKDTYEIIHGPATEDFVWEQIDEKGLGDVISKQDTKQSKTQSTAQLASRLWNEFGKHLLKKFGGFVYTGGFDKESVVCWYPGRQVEPLEWSSDRGETWQSVKSFKEFDRGEKKLNVSQHTHEAVRSMQRAKDLIERYKPYSDDKLKHAMESQLARVADPAKRDMRKRIFQQALDENRPSVKL